MAALRPWRYVTLDATGTLLRPAESIGATYLRFWEAASGQTLSSSRRAAASDALTTHFPTAFRLRSRASPNFGANGTDATAFRWWQELILDVMNRAQVADCRAHHQEQADRFVRDLYAHYARPEAWTVFADVQPTLERLDALDVPMGVISNFDERLETLLVGLQLRDHFEVVTTSFTESEMKPHADIFLSTFKKLQREEGDVDVTAFLHVGDHLSKDYKAAKTLGAHANLLWRSTTRAPPSDVQENELLTTLEQLLKGQ